MADDRLVTSPLKSDPSARAYNAMAERLGSIDCTPLLVYLIDTVPAPVLPYLAEQFHILGNEGWLLAINDGQKRSLIKAAIELHRHKGTRWAVEQVLVVLGHTGEVQEWFEYAGDPYHFRVIIYYNALAPLSTDQKRQLAAMIWEYKNKRSWGNITLRASYAFRAGESRCGDRLGTSEETTDLEELLV